MKYKNPTCLSIDPQTAEEARKWAETERVQLSTYVEIAIQQRNKWHERQEANKIEKQNLLTLEQAKQLLINCNQINQNEADWDKDVEAAKRMAKAMWSK